MAVNNTEWTIAEDVRILEMLTGDALSTIIVETFDLNDKHTIASHQERRKRLIELVNSLQELVVMPDSSRDVLISQTSPAIPITHVDALSSIYQSAYVLLKLLKVWNLTTSLQVQARAKGSRAH